MSPAFTGRMKIGKTDYIVEVRRADQPHRQTSDEMSGIASATLRDPDASARERRLAASVLGQDETAGTRGRG